MTMTLCAHIFRRVGASICPFCGLASHDFDWERDHREHSAWVLANPDHEYEVWSI